MFMIMGQKLTYRAKTNVVTTVVDSVKVVVADIQRMHREPALVEFRCHHCEHLAAYFTPPKTKVRLTSMSQGMVQICSLLS
jgi:hypothetical protein